MFKHFRTFVPRKYVNEFYFCLVIKFIEIIVWNSFKSSRNKCWLMEKNHTHRRTLNSNPPQRKSQHFNFNCFGIYDHKIQNNLFGKQQTLPNSWLPDYVSGWLAKSIRW